MSRVRAAPLDARRIESTRLMARCPAKAAGAGPPDQTAACPVMASAITIWSRPKLLAR